MEWLAISGPEVLGVLVSVALVYASVVVLTRIVGLRSFSKMSSGDFAMTVAVGSILGSAIVNAKPSVPVAVLGLAGLFVGQFLMARVRARTSWAGDVLDNEPIMLMRDGKIIHENLRKANVAEADLRAKLREANVLRLEQVAAVVFETTGDVSVLHGTGDKPPEVDDYLLADVREG